MESVKIDWKGLKCDYCDFTDESIPRIEFENYLDKPCRSLKLKQM